VKDGMKKGVEIGVDTDPSIDHGINTSPTSIPIDTIISDKVTAAINTAMNNQLVVINDQQTIIKDIAATQQQITDQVYKKVTAELNATLAPKISNMVEWVGQKTLDGDDVVDQYRRAWEHKYNSNARMITNTDKQDKRIISENVRTFFEVSSSSDDEY
jgi:hypothetical protein